MTHKKPISVFIDGDEEMRNTIEKVLPDTRHRLRAWHVGKNVKLNLQMSERVTAFKCCMYHRLMPNEFEVHWKDMVDTFGLQDNDWVKMMYSKRERWAATFLRGHFFGGLQSTQRCEGMNRCMKDFLRQNGVKLFECIPQLDRALLRVRNKCAMDEVKAKNSAPVLITELFSLEQHAATIYTERVFEIVRKQLNCVGALICKSVIAFRGCRVFPISKYGDGGSEWTVVLYNE